MANVGRRTADSGLRARAIPLHLASILPDGATLLWDSAMLAALVAWAMIVAVAAARYQYVVLIMLCFGQAGRTSYGLHAELGIISRKRAHRV